MLETLKMWVQSLGWEDPMEKDMAIHPSILAWRILWTEDPDGLQSGGHKELDTNEHTLTALHFFMNSRSILHDCNSSQQHDFAAL